jgi:hypothetical protein
MAEQTKRARGRPKGAKDRNPRKVKPETPPVSAYGASPAQTDEMIEDMIEAEGRRLMAEGNGLSTEEYDAEVERRFPVETATTAKPAPTPPAKPTFPNLFIHTVENGYIIRPAYPQGDRLASTDVRTWIVPTREALAALIVELMAVPRLEQESPQKLPQPGMFYSPPIIMETGAG